MHTEYEGLHGAGIRGSIQYSEHCNFVYAIKQQCLCKILVKSVLSAKIQMVGSFVE
jgi:hypothetical protein